MPPRGASTSAPAARAPAPQGREAASAAAAGQSRYGWLAATLRSRILHGEWSPGDAIPPEALLARSYGVALGTIRQALSLLVAEGLLERRHGRGTFVTPGLGGATMMRFFRFRQGGELATPRSRILARRVRRASDDECDAFALPSAGRVVALERLRSIDARPCLLERIVVPLPLFDGLATSDPAAWGDLLYPAYQRLCGVVVREAEDHLSFSRLTASEARRLRLERSHPCVRVDRRAFDLAGRCVELRVTLGDAFAFEYTARVR